jgi:hypothetical protein
MSPTTAAPKRKPASRSRARLLTREELLEQYRAACLKRDRGADPGTRRSAHTTVQRLAPELRRVGVWVFNGHYNDLAQIIPFVEAYWTIYEELKDAGQYPYNASFEGRIPGLEDSLPQEETPIYLLQQLRNLVEGHERLAETLDGGYRRLEPSSPRWSASRASSSSTSSTPPSATRTLASSPTSGTTPAGCCPRASALAGGAWAHSTRSTSDDRRGEIPHAGKGAAATRKEWCRMSGGPARAR